MDVKTVFLNVGLDEEIYIDQPQRYVEKGNEHKVYELNKLLYGLKQALRQWSGIKSSRKIKKFGF